MLPPIPACGLGLEHPNGVFVTGDIYSRGTFIPVPIPFPLAHADRNRDGGVDIVDLLDFLAQFESGSICADLSSDEAITVDDLIIFLDWFEEGRL